MAKIHFKVIELNNFLSYEHESIILDNPGYIFVHGENNNPLDSAKSNGCGKSTIFNAIVWALTGKTISGSKNVENVYLDGKTSVELLFTCNDNEYRIRREKNPSNLFIYINDENKSGKGIRDTEKLLIEYLPDITESLINSVIILGQGLPQRFSNNTPSGRKEVLETLSKSDFMIDDLKTRLSNRKSQLDAELRSNEDEKITLMSKSSIIERTLGDTINELNNLDTNEHLTESINELNDTLTNIKEDKADIVFQIDQLKNIIERNNSKLLKLQSDKLEEEQSIDVTKLEAVKEKINSLKFEIQTVEKEIIKLESVVDVCPTCGQKLPGVTKLDTSSLHEKLDTLNLTVAYCMSEQVVLTEEYNQAIIDIDNKYKDLWSDLNDSIHDDKQTLESYERKLSKYNSKIHETELKLSKLSIELEHLIEREQELNNKILNLRSDIDSINEDLVVINNTIDSLHEKLDVNTKMSTFIKREFRGYLLINVVNFIADKCKLYSQQVFGNTQLDFKLDGNNISIMFDHKEYESLSGGEKQKVDIIIQLALRDMLCSFLNFSSNILVLDEITDALDSVGAQKVFNLISNNLNDVETIYIISHHTDFDIPYDDEIHIIKGVDKISRIV